MRAAADYVLSTDWDAVRAHEESLLAAALDGLGAMSHVTLYGAAARPRADADVQRRRPHRRRGRRPRSPSARSRSGTATTTRGSSSAYLGLAPHGAVRAGFVHYNDEADAERLLAAVADLAA